ncbi:MAG TPA: cyclopropane-fatty-acyl-phospholipid synthase family protein [Spongiibacteraceae bacterium]|nr:cyclopropane-fatty-acyl-phospholipid synthase family protein [Spongiibacteraceae bacterium]
MNKMTGDLLTNNSLSARQALPRDARLILNLLAHIEGGTLQICLANGEKLVFGSGGLSASFRVHNNRVFSRVLTRGDIGFCESYVDRDWDSNDLTSLLTLMARNRDTLRKAVQGSWFGLLTARLRHLLNRNSRAGSKRNIMAHYDLGNDFYRLWLDPGMTYSSAVFADSKKVQTLETAQHNKYQRILGRLQAKPGQRVLEIGCGWGAFAELACANGLHLTGLTLSPSQLQWAQQRVPIADFRLQDYRDINERFDHVVSIEMIEAVGEHWWPNYFKVISNTLKRGGKAVIQGIVIRDELFAEYRKSTDFIQQYIFPGGMLPTRTIVRNLAAQQGLVVSDEFNFGLDYARTLREWRNNFEQQWQNISKLGFDEKFRRLWRLYLCYCEAGFIAGTIDVVQFELQHSDH